ncbi:hypothetical protein H6768_03255 [Candidatus Peribacteria bacterium]|nr:hypothetical protein [Candidatus Peribacteria bacterium]
MYTLFADMSGLITQDAKRYIGILPSTNVDLTTDEIIELAGESDIDIPSSSVPSIFDTLESRYPEFTPFQKQISQIVARGILNMLLRVYTEPLLEKKLKKEMPIFEIILDKRNAIIAQAISESPIPNIYIHYGALHYSGVLRLLQEKDPRWQEIARTEFQVIR